MILNQDKICYTLYFTSKHDLIAITNNIEIFIINKKTDESKVEKERH